MSISLKIFVISSSLICVVLMMTIITINAIIIRYSMFNLTNIKINAIIIICLMLNMTKHYGQPHYHLLTICSCFLVLCVMLMVIIISTNTIINSSSFIIKTFFSSFLVREFSSSACVVLYYRVIFYTGTPLKVSDYIVNPIKKVLSVRISLPKKIVIFRGGQV